MFKFEKEQSVWDFNGTKLGGQPGEYPTVLAASIFYNKHEAVLDDKTGKIDKAMAEALWNRCQVLSDTTGIPHMIQILAEYPAGVRELHSAGLTASTTRLRS